MKQVKINRRQFLLIAGGTLGAAALTCTGLAKLDEFQPQVDPVDIIEKTYGETNSMNDKILVTYATRAGSTAGVADAIAKTLAEKGAQVDIRPMKEVKDLSTYRAVVAGSAIQGRWLPEAMQFMKTYRAELARKPFAAFMVCITLAMKDGEKYREGIKDWMAPVRSLVRPVSEGYFAGALDCSKLPFGLNGLGMLAAAAFGIFPKGDHRDWNAIRAWAESIYPMLTK